MNVEDDVLDEMMKLSKEPLDQSAYIDWLGKRAIALEKEVRELRQQNEELEAEARDLRRKNLRN